MRKSAADTRARILSAADDLFYGEGIRSVSIDAIAQRAGVTKRTLYYHFASKDDLIAAYLDHRDGSMLTGYQTWFAETGEDRPLAERIGGLFRKLAERAGDPSWKGCSFGRAASELAGEPGHPGFRIASRHKKGFEAWLAGLIAAAGGIAEPAVTARQIMLLLDGAAAQSLIHQDPAYAEAAVGAVRVLLDPGHMPPCSLPRA